MGTYSALSQRAYNLIKRKGRAVTISRDAETSDPITQTKSITASTASTFAVSVNVDVGRATTLFGSIVHRNINRLYVACKDLALVPKVGDRITWGGYDWNVLRGGNIDPDGTEVIVSDVYMER
jgi:hypothetical protein